MAKKKSWYCIKCLRKYGGKKVPSDRICQCGEPLRNNTARIVAQVVTRLKRQRGLERPRPSSGYQKYTSSKLWRTIRERVLERDSYTCLMCGEKANCVHHRSYDKETMDGHNDDNLASLCRRCHKSIEFRVGTDGKKVKNGLHHANYKLDEAIRHREAQEAALA